MKIRMVVMCEWEPGTKKHAKNVADLRRFGVIVFEGQSECDSFIINESVMLNPDKTIKMAIPMERTGIKRDSLFRFRDAPAIPAKFFYIG